MTNPIKRFFCGLLLAALLLVNNAWSQQRPDLVLGTYTYASNNRLGSLEALAGYLNRETGFTVAVKSYPNVPALLRAIRADSVQLAVLNTVGYLLQQRHDAGRMIPLLNLNLGMDTATQYGGCIIAARSTDIFQLAQLRNAARYTLALVAPSSTSGNMVPRLLLNSIGITDAASRFDTYYAGTHQQAVADVLSGKAQLAGCGCAEVDTAKLRHDFDRKAVVVASFNDIPLGPLAYHHKLPSAVVKKVQQALLLIHEKDAEGFRTFCSGWTEFRKAKSFQLVTDHAYDPFRRMFGNNESLWQLIQ